MVNTVVFLSKIITPLLSYVSADTPLLLAKRWYTSKTQVIHK